MPHAEGRDRFLATVKLFRVDEADLLLAGMRFFEMGQLALWKFANACWLEFGYLGGWNFVIAWAWNSGGSLQISPQQFSLGFCHCSASLVFVLAFVEVGLILTWAWGCWYWRFESLFPSETLFLFYPLVEILSWGVGTGWFRKGVRPGRASSLEELKHLDDFGRICCFWLKEVERKGF